MQADSVDPVATIDTAAPLIPGSAPVPAKPKHSSTSPDWFEVEWEEAEALQSALWGSIQQSKPPPRILVGDDQVSADSAWRRVCEGDAMLWRGDYHNARQLLQALTRRAERRFMHAPKPRKEVPLEPQAAFHRMRQLQGQRARILSGLLVPFTADHVIPLRRAPDVAAACRAAWEHAPHGAPPGDYVAPLRDLLGMIGAYEWRKKGILIPALGAHIHAHYGVFAPVRNEYLDLVAHAPLGKVRRAFDIGTGTGVIAALLARRGVPQVVASEVDPRALACARDNFQRLGLADRVQVVELDLFPPGRADLIVCNPPWLPGRPASSLERAIYDPEEHMLRGFLAGLDAHLEPEGEAWLILSDLAQRLGLRAADAMPQLFAAHGLRVIARLDIKPRHKRVSDSDDMLHSARAGETTHLWRLTRATFMSSGE